MAGQKEMAFRNQENGMGRLVLGRSLVAELAVVRSRRIIGDVIAVAERMMMVGGSGVNTRVIPLQRSHMYIYVTSYIYFRKK